MLSLQLGELCKENAFVKGQIVTLEETKNVHEMEAKASRETITRLASEVNREQQKAASCVEEKDKLNQVQYVERVYEAEIENQLWMSTLVLLTAISKAPLSRGAGAPWASVT